MASQINPNLPTDVIKYLDGLQKYLESCNITQLAPSVSLIPRGSCLLPLGKSGPRPTYFAVKTRYKVPVDN